MTDDYEMRIGWDNVSAQEVLVRKQIVDNYYIAEGDDGYLIVNIDEIKLYSGE